MRTFRIGLVGGGMVSHLHLNALAKDARARVCWLADLNGAARNATGGQFGIPNLTADYHLMLADPTLDAVIVCTPPRTHTKVAMDVLAAGKHLLVEKPMATTLDEAHALTAAAARYPDLKVSGCSARHSRLTPKYPQVKRMIDDGRLGRVYYVHHRSVISQKRCGIEYNPPAKWFLDRQISGGGPIYDWGVYDLAFHLGLLGEPRLEKVEAFCINGLDKVDSGAPIFTVEEHGAAFMTFEGGLRYYWERSSNAHCDVPNQTTIYGTEGGIRFGYCSWDGPEIEYFYTDNSGRGKPKREVITIVCANHDDPGALDTAWLNYLCGDGPVPMPLDLELRNLEILHKVYMAANW